MALQVVAEVDIMGDEALIERLARITRVLLATGIAAAVVLGVFGPRPDSWIAFAGLAFLGYALSLPVHELIHAAFFALLARGPVSIEFGFSQFMLYTSCPGTLYSRGAFQVILFAPFVVLSIVYLCLGLAFDSPLLFWSLYALHTAGCSGDFLFAQVIWEHPEANACEDTEFGMRLIKR